MGMSSSQARLLTLTARMHQIEYKAAKLEAMKLQMANESSRVYEEYLNALDKTKIEAKTLNTDASITYQQFSAQDVYTFNKMPNQYTLTTIDGKTLIPQSMYNTYETSNYLSDFLKKSGVNITTEFIANPDETTEEMIIWRSEEPDINDYFAENATENLSFAFEEAGSSCYNSAVGGDVSCYAHVLAHIIDYTAATGFGTDGCNEDFYNSMESYFTTTTGKLQRLYAYDITGAGMDDDGGIKDTIMKKISEILNTGEKAPIFDTDTSFANTDLSTEFTQLSSMYNTDGTTKTLKQWAKDLYYLCKNYGRVEGATVQNVSATITVFQAHLSDTLEGMNYTQYKTDYANWKNSKPKITYIHTDDKDEAQWYTNIWKSIQNENCKEYKQTINGRYSGKYTTVDENKSTDDIWVSDFNTPETSSYIVIPDDMFNSPEWLSNAINNGFVVLQIYDKKQVSFFDTSVAVDVDLKEVPDEVEIKKAEAKYEADMKKIDLKDRRYDTDLAAFETERNAIKQEMETLKTVAKDNIERTFKLFS